MVTLKHIRLQYVKCRLKHRLNHRSLFYSHQYSKSDRDSESKKQNPDLILVSQDVLTRKLASLRALKTEFENYSGTDLNRIDNDYGTSRDEDSVIYYFRQRLVKILFNLHHSRLHHRRLLWLSRRHRGRPIVLRPALPTRGV